MASYTPTRAKNATLVANTADTLTFQQAWDAVEITNADASATIYARVDGTAATVAGDDCIAILPASSKVINLGGNRVVSVISSGTPVYSCEGVK